MSATTTVVEKMLEFGESFTFKDVLAIRVNLHTVLYLWPWGCAAWEVHWDWV